MRGNAECLRWLDRTGNEAVHAVTRKAPRELFQEEMKALIEHKPITVSLYPQKIVTASNVSTISYNKSIYDLPLGRFKQGDKLRTEELDNELLIYDPITEELVARHRLSNEIGKVVKLKTKEPETRLIYVKQAKTLYGNHKTANRFIDYVAQEKPRYVREQMALLKKIVQEYDREDVLKAMSNCMKRKAYCATEV